MCITFFQITDNKEVPFKFVFGFNRDVGVNRPTLPMNPFEEDKNIIAGRDLVGKGTWLGINIKTNIIAILTNYHQEEFINVKNIKYGRGYIPLEFLNSQMKSQDDSQILKKMNKIMKEKDEYNAFNIIVGNFTTNNFYYICNKYEGDKEMPYKLDKDCHTLCNSEYFVQWEKAVYGLNLFKEIISKNNQKDQKGDLKNIQKEIYDLMLNNKQFDENVEEESSIFVEKYKNSYYNDYRGTISTCIMTLDQNNQLEIIEYTFNTKKNTINKSEPLVKKLNYKLKI